MKTAIVIGATGLVGNALVHQLLSNPKYSNVKVIHRRSTKINHPKLEETIIDFEHMQGFQNAIQGDVLFSCMGTTIKAAGSQEQQYKVDVTYPLEIAKIASKNKVKDYVLVSSVGANASSRNFYPRIKGELEEEVSKLAFEKIRIMRPSILDGLRKENRVGEQIGLFLFRFLGKLPFISKYRPISDHTVARAMQNSLHSPEAHRIIELEEIFNEAG